MAKINFKPPLQATARTPLDVALQYAAEGLPVFPCRPRYEMVTNKDGKEELKKPKSPLTVYGFKDATKTTRIIERWWQDNPDALIGVPTGALSGFWVLDIDVPGEEHKADGGEWLASMIEQHGPLPETRTVTTASGGTHYYWRHVEGVRNKAAFAPGVDTRGDGGFVCMPGSVLEDGTFYEWSSDLPIADAPDWLLEFVLTKPITAPPAQPMTYKSGTNDCYVDAAVDDELRNLSSTTQGGRGFKLNQSAFSLGQIVASGALSRSDAEDGLYNAAVANGLVATDGEREVRAKIRRGLDAGIKQPRQIPEQQPQQDNTRLVDITRIIQNGLAKAKKESAGYHDGGYEEYVPDYSEDHSEEYSADHESPDGDYQDPANDNAPNIEPEEDSVFRATAFKWIDPSTLPRREFAFGTHFIRKYVSVTVSPGGLGKTSNSIVEALAMASGKPLTGTKPTERLKVWLFNAEDPRDEMERRIMAACIHYKLKPEDIDGHLFLDSGREQELIIMHEDKKTGLQINEPVVEAMVAQIQSKGIDVMIVDPFVSTHRVNENDNGAIDKVAKLWAQIADYTNCAVDVVHHLKKLADREATVEDARGAVSLIGAARSVRVLNRMSPEQATKAGLSTEERFSYFYIHHGKVNLTKMDNTEHWRKMESVPLGNGGKGNLATLYQDYAGVVTEWKWPSKDEIAATVPEDAKREVLVKLANQNCRESPQSDDWAGYVVAAALGIHIETSRAMTPEKRKVKAVLDSWIANGILATVDEDDPKHFGRKIKYVRPAPHTTSND